MVASASSNIKLDFTYRIFLTIVSCNNKVVIYYDSFIINDFPIFLTILVRVDGFWASAAVIENINEKWKTIW